MTHRKGDLNRYLADATSEKLLSRKKIAHVKSITTILGESGRVFDEVWKSNDLIISTVADHNLNLALMEGSKRACKPLFVVTNIDQIPRVFSFTDLSIEGPRAKFIKASNDGFNRPNYDIDKDPLNYPSMQGLSVYWALAIFEIIFHRPFEDLNKCITNPVEFFSTIEGTVIPENRLFEYAQLMEILKVLFAPTYPVNYEDCIHLAFQYYQVDLCSTSTISRRSSSTCYSLTRSAWRKRSARTPKKR